MASLPDDDGPTMSGLPVDRHVGIIPDHADDADDTTTAEAGPPASKPNADDPPEHDEEDRTVQVAPAKPARRAVPHVLAPPTLASPPTPSHARGAPPSSSSPSTPMAVVPSTQPTGAPAVTPPMRPAAGSTTEANEAPPDDGDDDDDDGELSEEELTDLDAVDEDSIEDSITATAPRLDAVKLIEAVTSSQRGLPIVIPGSIEIRTVDHDALLDETEIRTLPGHLPLDIPATLRASHAGPQPSQPPPPRPRPAAGRPPSIVLTDVTAADDDEDDDDGVTTQAQAPRVSSIPDIGAPTLAPKSLAPETVARGSRPGSSPGSSEPVPTARSGMTSSLGADSLDELATRPGVEGADEPPTRPGVEGASEPPTRPGIGEPPTHPGVRSGPEPSKRAISSNSYANEDDDEDESITTREKAPQPFGDDDGALDDGTDGTTQKVKRKRSPATSSPADGEVESITTQAPGPLTNMLRVIASGSVSDAEGATAPGAQAHGDMDAEDELPENRTAVMANAPLKRVISDLVAPAPLNPIRPTGPPLTHRPQASAAPRLEPTSESGLRVARAGSPEHASLGPVPIADGRSSGIVSNALASDGSISAPIDIRAHAATEMAFPSGQPSLHDIDLGKGPRYGLLVAVVAVISIIVPITLYFALRQGDAPPTPGVVSELASEIETPAPARAKAARTRNGGYVVPPGPSAAPKGSGTPKRP